MLGISHTIMKKCSRRLVPSTVLKPSQPNTRGKIAPSCDSLDKETFKSPKKTSRCNDDMNCLALWAYHIMINRIKAAFLQIGGSSATVRPG